MNKTKFWIYQSVVMMLWAYVAIAWFINVIKLISCDFDAPYKEEFIHGIGMIPGVSMITCWY